MKNHLFQNKYRISSNRLQGYDYGSNGLYFITICTKYREHYFGQIKNDTMCISEEGCICIQEIEKTSRIRESIAILDYIVMPNHLHMIIEIDKENDIGYAGDGCNPSLQAHIGNKFGPQSKNIPAIIRGMKGAVTSKIRKFNTEFSRQSGYHDHIIRNSIEHKKIIEYIHTNISKRDIDCHYTL